MTSFSGPIRRGAFLGLVGIPVIPLRQSCSFIYHHGEPPKASNSRAHDNDPLKIDSDRRKGQNRSLKLIDPRFGFIFLATAQDCIDLRQPLSLHQDRQNGLPCSPMARLKPDRLQPLIDCMFIGATLLINLSQFIVQAGILRICLNHLKVRFERFLFDCFSRTGDILCWHFHSPY